MSQWGQAIGKLLNGEELSYQESYQLMDQVMSGELGEIRLASMLSLVAGRTLGIDELHGFADAMQNRAEPIDLPTAVVDIVGTGGDRANTVNISTMAAIVISAAGVPVVKHGNRASTSACGSADVLEALGVNLRLSPSAITRRFSETNIAFLFANLFHPSMKHAAAVRRGLGFPTVFNILGPLTNPARPSASAIGVSGEQAAPLVAGVFAKRGNTAVIFRGAERGLDELTTVEPADIWQVHEGKVRHQRLDSRELIGLPASSLGDLRGGNPVENAKVVWEVLEGKNGPISDAVALNAATGLFLQNLQLSPVDLDQVDDDFFEDGLQQAYCQVQVCLKDGIAYRHLENWIAASQN